MCTDKEFKKFLNESIERNRQNGYCGTNTTVNDAPLTQDQLKAINSVIAPTIHELKAKITPAVTVTKTGKERKPRTGKSMQNKYQPDFISLGSYHNMNTHLEDVFIGASRLTTTNSHVSSRLCFRLMQELEFITTEAVFLWVNKSRCSDQQIDVRYAQEIAERLRAIVNALDYHAVTFEQNTGQFLDGFELGFDVEADARDYLRHLEVMKIAA
ncbi:hypothetical protein K6R49_003738 [Escherichia coli]|uniref:hypothetical protein n=1 Tax=Buttiauxella noackiae TaxID=82992 RepID=UPI0035A74141|nr:hypothetical protein [Escherichia coli]